MRRGTVVGMEDWKTQVTPPLESKLSVIYKTSLSLETLFFLPLTNTLDTFLLVSCVLLSLS